jgi:hypothetical protein
MSWNSRPLLVLVQGGMELSWLYASIAFTTLALVGRHLPFGHALAALVAAAIMGRFALGRGLRNYTVLILQAVSFGGAILSSVYALNYRSFVLFSLDWLRLALYGPHVRREWAELILLCLSVVPYWVGGAFLGKRRMTYHAICSRFDIGLAAFFVLFLMELVIEVKGGIRVDSASHLYSLSSFLLLGLVAIGISRAQPATSRSFLPGYGIAGIILSFSAVVLLADGSLLLFFSPVLRKVAEVTYAAAGNGAHFAAPFVVGILRFLFGPRNIRPDPPAASSHGTAGLDHIVAPTTWWGHLVDDILQWGMKGLFLLTLLFAAGLLVYFLMRWLINRSDVTTDRERLVGSSAGWLSRLRLILISLFSWLRRWLRGYENGADLYRGLQSWGRRSGLSPHLSDTPAEFGRRLGHVHPELKIGVDTITSVFNKEFYGNMSITGQELAGARSSLRSLCSPRHWMRRLKTRLTRPESWTK